ncbi:MAG: hypothetical protein LCH54_16295 [Bacteroidetes bacterium]|nr:hypothetical protein [Bacteroidota bacterium]
MTIEKLFSHHITILNRIHDHPERYNQIEKNNAVLNAKDFFTFHSDIPESHRLEFSNFPWHDLLSSGFPDFLKMSEKIGSELKNQNENL